MSVYSSNARATGWGSTWSSTLTMTFSLTLCTRTSCDVLWREKITVLGIFPKSTEETVVVIPAKGTP